MYPHDFRQDKEKDNYDPLDARAKQKVQKEKKVGIRLKLQFRNLNKEFY